LPFAVVNAALDAAVASLPTPDYQRPNLVLTFLVPLAGGVAFDSAGNEVSNTQAIVVQASVRRPTKQATNTPIAGAGRQELELEGRLVKPKFLPASINNQLKAFAVYSDSISKAAYEGEWVFLPTTQARISGITQKFGQKISGSLILTGAA
jgi:hypothetical protein